jgi:hypothetical protein
LSCYPILFSTFLKKNTFKLTYIYIDTAFVHNSYELMYTDTAFVHNSYELMYTDTAFVHNNLKKFSIFVHVDYESAKWHEWLFLCVFSIFMFISPKVACHNSFQSYVKHVKMLTVLC